MSDTLKFEGTEERQFWRDVFIAVLSVHGANTASGVAGEYSDRAVLAYRERCQRPDRGKRPVVSPTSAPGGEF